ncbi:hypothetical protein QTG54_014121 [Skeletonema marinoi]|uniref:Uncharacterized protein n=1 Tax=Skeletonema marinoi TaxID=267567 RepID=A0AAD8XX62_9STRA|nr:hypothetical protein QTG54_014121 [Skeletonema marinoi]
MAWSAELAAGASAWAKEKAKLAQLKDQQPSWGNDLRPGGAVMWRTALYVGCAAEIAPIEDCPETQRACFCQVTNCRYSRTTNCGVNNKNDWVAHVLDQNGICDTVFCPGADENGTIVEGACHV